MENSFWLPQILKEYAIIKGIQIDLSRPNDVAQLIMPSKDIEDETKICLYDFLTYLTSEGRKMVSLAVSMEMPYFAEKAKLDNKGKALARLELELLDRKNEEVEHYLKHNRFEEMDTRFFYRTQKRTGYAPVPTTLLGLGINECLENPEDPVASFIIKMFKDKRFNSLKIFDEEVSPWANIQDNGPKLN